MDLYFSMGIQLKPLDIVILLWAWAVYRLDGRGGVSVADRVHQTFDR
jgi:hypothetical protein